MSISSLFFYSFKKPKIHSLYLEYVLPESSFFVIITSDYYARFYRQTDIDTKHIYTRQRGAFVLNSFADVWASVLSQLKKDLSETTFSAWFDEK